MSFQTLSNGYKTSAELAAHEAKWGRFNDAPPNFTEIPAEEFAQSGFFTWVKTGIEYRQILVDPIVQERMLTPVKTMLAVTMFYMNHGDNYALAHDYWGKQVRYFKFAHCFHQWKEINASEAGKRAMNCYHYCKCVKCGDSWEYDSSG